MEIRLLMISLLLICNADLTFACDVCGSSIGGNYFGIITQNQNSFLGLRYQNQRYRSEHLRLFQNETPIHSFETFQTTELWGRYVPIKKLQLFAFVPYNYFTKNEEGQKSVTSGIGDVSVMAHYLVFNTAYNENLQYKQALQFGLGIKFPSGKSNSIPQQSGMLIPNMQTGTGSWDVPLTAIYTIRKNNWGLNAEATYRLNSVNKSGYQFGNRSSVALRCFYGYSYKNLSVLPQLGANYEYALKDRNEKRLQDYTGGYSLLGTAGLDVYFKKMILNVSTQKPLSQNLAKGQVYGNQRFNAGLAIML